MATGHRLRNQQGEGSRLREELIQAAGRVLATSPDRTELSLRAVAREAGVAAPSVYLQFGDKADLLAAVLRDHFDQLYAVIVEAMDNHGEPEARLRAGCIAYCGFALERPGPYRVLFEYKPAVELVLTPFGATDDPGARAFATLVTAIEDCMTDGVAPTGDPFRVASAVWTAMHGYVTLVRARPGFPWLPLAEHLEDILVGLVGVARLQPEPEPLIAAAPHRSPLEP